MTRLLQKYASLLSLSFMLGFLIPRFFGPNLQANVAGVNPYLKAEDWETAVVEYHVKVNEISNEFLEKLFESESPNVIFPEEESGCSADNLSTYCLGVTLSEELAYLETYLADQKEVLDQDAEGSVAGVSLENAFELTAIKQSRIDEELKAAGDALDLNLAVYNQAQLVYPLHTELLVFQQNLEIYRDNLASVRDVIETYPGRFHDATTVECK